ncbi:uncharacterized protein [Dermacentor albipictus]|uniref:uncharacterized protein isoform X1 n=1 Tax=Dermacentor albipictus TaxID=60249 RepID=UPI0031FC1C67
MATVSVEGDDIPREEYEDEAGWRVVKRGGCASEPTKSHGTQDQAARFSSENAFSNRWNKGQKARQIMAASRMPSLPKAEYKIIVRPRDSFNVTDYGINRLECCGANAAGIPRKESEDDTVCANYKQNILVISTPSEEHAEKYRTITRLRMGDKEFEANAYESAPEDTSKGVIRGVTHEVSPREIVEMLVTPKNPTVLMAKRMGNTTNVIILFDGHHVPNYVRYGRALVKCSLYRKQIDICYQCGRLGHRADVCPNPNSRICRGCGLENPPQDHECEAKCQLCGKDHPTADRRCNARYKLPYLVKRRRWERVRREEEETMYHEREAERLYRPGREDWRQRSEYRTKDGSGLEDFPKLQARERGRSTSNRTRSRSRSRSRSRPKTSNTESTRAQGGGRSQSPKGKSNVNDAAGPLQVDCWLCKVRGGNYPSCAKISAPTPLSQAACRTRAPPSVVTEPAGGPKQRCLLCAPPIASNVREFQLQCYQPAVHCAYASVTNNVGDSSVLWKARSYSTMSHRNSAVTVLQNGGAERERGCRVGRSATQREPWSL